MAPKHVVVVPMSHEHIAAVASLHQAALDGFLSQLGHIFLSQFYHVLLSLPDVYTIVALMDGTVVGFATVTTRPDQLLWTVIRRRFFWFFFFFLNHFSVHPRHALLTVQTVLYPGLQSKSAELLSLAVDKRQRGQGIGTVLFREIAKICQKQKCHSFAISAYVRLPANTFYRKMGCRVNKTFLFLGEEMNYYYYRV